MRSNIDIDDAVAAKLKLLARQAHCRAVLRWGGKLHWGGDRLEAVAAADLGGRDPAGRRARPKAPRCKSLIRGITRPAGLAALSYKR